MFREQVKRSAALQRRNCARDSLLFPSSGSSATIVLTVTGPMPLIDEIQDLASSFHESTELHLFVRLSDLRRGLYDLTEQHDRACVDGIRFRIASNTNCEAAEAARIDDGQCNPDRYPRLL